MRYSFFVLIPLILIACGNDSRLVPATTIITADTPGKMATKKEVEEDEEKEKYFPSLDSIGALPAQIAKYIPADYLPLDTAIGDLNQDGIDDVLLVIKSKWEDTLSYPNDGTKFKRPLLLLLGQRNGTYIQAGRNDDVVMYLNG